MRHRNYAALSAVLLLVGACGTAARGGTAEADLGEGFRRGATCGPDAYPQELPPVDAVVDSAAVARAVAGLSAPDQPAPAGHALFSLAFDQYGDGLRWDLLEHSTTPAWADSVWRAVSLNRRQADAAEREWGVRLRVDLGEPVELTVAHRVLCRPVARNPELRHAMQGHTPMASRIRRGARERTVPVRALVNEFGTVTSARIARGELAGSAVEQDIARFLQQFQFYPGTIDGEPTSAWIEVPIRIRTP